MFPLVSMLCRSRRTGLAILFLWLALMLAPALALAQPAASAAPAAAAAPAFKTDTGDTAWMLVSTALVLMMTIPGLALFYGGMVRKKNVIATVAQSFAITAVVTVVWFVAGYSIAFGAQPGAANAWWGGLGNAVLAHVTMDKSYAIAGATPTIPEYVYLMYQMTFAIITPALICGAFAERFKFSALLLFTVLWSLFVYAPIAHWVWGGGVLGGLGVMDFAGGTVVHINAGVAGLVCALVLGKRRGLGHENMAPNNLVYTLIGASLLWVGWFGFNAGSAVGANALAGVAMANTQVATAAATLAWMAVEWAHRKKPTLLGMASGAVAGLVAVTPASGFVNADGRAVGRHRRRGDLLLLGGVPEERAEVRRQPGRLRRARGGRLRRRHADRGVRRRLHQHAAQGARGADPVRGLHRHHRLVRRSHLRHPDGLQGHHRPSRQRGGRSERSGPCVARRGDARLTPHHPFRSS